MFGLLCLELEILCGHFGLFAHAGHFATILGYFAVSLGYFWGHFGLLAHWGLRWDTFGLLCGTLGIIWGHVGFFAHEGNFGTLLGFFVVSVGYSGVTLGIALRRLTLGHLWATLWRAWDRLGSPWALRTRG